MLILRSLSILQVEIGTRQLHIFGVQIPEESCELKIKMSESLAKQTEIAFMGMNEITKGERTVRREKGQEWNPENNTYLLRTVNKVRRKMYIADQAREAQCLSTKRKHVSRRAQSTVSRATESHGKQKPVESLDLTIKGY